MLARILMAILVVLNSLVGFMGACRAECATAGADAPCCCSAPTAVADEPDCSCCGHAASSTPAPLPPPSNTPDQSTLYQVEPGHWVATALMPVLGVTHAGPRDPLVYRGGACRRATICVRLT